uniref:ACT_7 domain-containing protein n=1 Tax=Heterorhabditis bacteriophora TaxID=37862 RepID=A0A1I7XM58_HETBA
MFIPSTVQSVDPRREEQYLVISSTLGPLAIWKCIMERVLFYSDCCDVPVSDIISSMEVDAPIVSMKILDDYSLGVLSTAGLHTISRSDSTSNLFVT